MKFNCLFKRFSCISGLLSVVLLSALLFTSCLDVDDDDNVKALQAEKALVAYLDAHYAGQWYQYHDTNVYYVPLTVGTGKTQSVKVGETFVRISYDVWKMDDYESWTPSESTLISTSDSLTSTKRQLLRNYLHGGPELYPYVNALSDFAPVIGEMHPGEKYRVFIAPSTFSEYSNFTRVVDVTLNSVVEWSDDAWSAEESAMFASYRKNHAMLRDAAMDSVTYSCLGNAEYFSAMDYEEYEVAGLTKSGVIRYMIHHAGIGDPLLTGGKQRITYSYGYLQRDHNGKPGVSYVEVENYPYRVEYNILADYKFGRGFDYALSRLRVGDEATIFVPSRLALGWTGIVQSQGLNSSSLYVVPPFSPMLFHVKIHASDDDE